MLESLVRFIAFAILRYQLEDRTTTTKAASVRKQLGTKNSKSNEGRQEKNGGVKGRDASAEELDREIGEEQITVGRTRRKDGG